MATGYGTGYGVEAEQVGGGVAVGGAPAYVAPAAPAPAYVAPAAPAPVQTVVSSGVDEVDYVAPAVHHQTIVSGGGYGGIGDGFDYSGVSGGYSTGGGYSSGGSYSMGGGSGYGMGMGMGMGGGSGGSSSSSGGSSSSSSSSGSSSGGSSGGSDSG